MNYCEHVNPYVKIRNGTLSGFLWILFTVSAITISFCIITGGAGIPLLPILLALCAGSPFIALFTAKSAVKKAFNPKIIDSEELLSGHEKTLIEMVSALCSNTKISVLPEVGIYQSNDLNAFATGARRNKALICVSSALLDSVDEDALLAILAHEIAHISNGDMLTLTLIQCCINVFAYCAEFPFRIVQALITFIGLSKSLTATLLYNIVVWLIRLFIQLAVLLVGSLITKLLSRHREFKADGLAAQLIGKERMISALQQIDEASSNVQSAEEESERNEKYAAFYFHVTALFDIFSTHPSIKRRIKRLQERY